MSIEAKHAYRFGFLKSEEWANFRLQAMAEKGAACYVCGSESIHNDVHHVHYPDKWRDTKTGHVVILCRKHHHSAHLLMEIYPTDTNLRKVAKVVKMELREFYRITNRLRRRKISLEVYCDLRRMVDSAWKLRRKMLTVGRHRV